MIGGEREVVKLSLSEGQPALNVLPVGLEGETLTLVCPFPVLPLEVPVRVTLPGQGDLGPVRATIRRVSVELMGEAALPRFKLHLILDGEREVEVIAPLVPSTPEEATAASFEPVEVDLEEPREVALDDRAEEPEEATVIVAPEAALASAEEEDAREAFPEEATAAEEPEVDDEVEDDSLWSLPRADMSWSAGELFGLDGASHDEPDLSWAEESLTDPAALELEDDPPWTGEHEIPSSAIEIRRARSRWPLRAAVTLALIASVSGLGYVMRHQILSMVSPFIGEGLSLASLGLAPSSSAVEGDPLSSLATSERAAPTPTPPPAAVAAAEEEATDELPTQAPEPVEEDQGSPSELDAESELAEVELPAALSPAELGGAEEQASAIVETSASASDPSVQVGEDMLRVVLPTRWPVTAARSYRLHDPTGIVVDVPGGMASERARWIDTDNDRVRSVRVLERETGVRFIIYLNDEFVPRYRVGYSRAGVMVDILGPDPRHIATK